MASRRRAFEAGFVALWALAGALGEARAEAKPGAALIEAARRGDLATVVALLERGVPVDTVDSGNNTPLIFAAREGHSAIAAILLDHGAALDWQDDERVTALILAAFRDHLAVVELLLARGAEANIVDRWGRTAVDYALRRGVDDPIARRLVAAGARSGVGR